MAEKNGSFTGFTEDEALEFHKFYQQGFLAFTAVAVVAHLLVWAWRPWIPDDDGYGAALIDAVTKLPMLG